MRLRFIPIGALCALSAFGLTAHPARAAENPASLPVQESVLTLDEALARTLRSSPALTVAAEELRAIEAEAALAGRLPDPELSVTLENVAGDGAYQDSDAAELTIELAQPIELGGKRRLRREVAELGRQLAANDRKLANADVQASTQQRFVAVLAAQEKLALAKEQAEVAARSLEAAEERIKAGKAPAIDRARLQGQVSLASLAVTQAERTLLTARQALATSWGAAQADFARVEGDLGILPDVPAWNAIDTSLEQTTAALNRRLATELRGLEVEQARANRIPDPSLTVGWRQFNESDESAWLFGLSLPLPLFSLGQEAVAAAGSRYHSARARATSDHHQARVALASTWQALADTRAEAEVLDSQVVPAAVEGFAAAEFGYRAGKFSLLELLDAQRSLFEAREQQLTARTNCHLAAIELQRLLGAESAAATH